MVRYEEVLREMVDRVRVGEKKGENFWTGRGMRQDCPLSPCLFILLLADLEEELEKEGQGRVKIGGRKVYSLADQSINMHQYADDIALMAENEGGMRRMMKGSKKYIEKKKLELNVGKTRIMRCRRGGERWKKTEWKWKSREIEEVRKFKYLEYVIMANGE